MTQIADRAGGHYGVEDRQVPQGPWVQQPHTYAMAAQFSPHLASPVYGQPLRVGQRPRLAVGRPHTLRHAGSAATLKLATHAKQQSAVTRKAAGGKRKNTQRSHERDFTRTRVQSPDSFLMRSACHDDVSR